MSELVEKKEWAVENVSTVGRVRVIEVYSKSNAQMIVDSANGEFEQRGSKTVSELVKI